MSPLFSFIYLVFWPFARGVGERYFLAVFTAFSFLVLMGGGSPGVLWPFALGSSLLYVAGVVFWRWGYLLVAAGVALDAVAYGAELGVLGVGGPYFGYVALLSWIAWRLGGSPWARMAGASAAVLQVVVNMYGVLRLYGAWTYAPLLAASLIPVLFLDRGGPGASRLPLLLVGVALGWGLFRFVVGLPTDFREGWLYLAYFAAFSLLAASLYCLAEEVRRGGAGGLRHRLFATLLRAAESRGGSPAGSASSVGVCSGCISAEDLASCGRHRGGGFGFSLLLSPCLFAADERLRRAGAR
jgi:hypothetical protein